MNAKEQNAHYSKQGAAQNKRFPNATDRFFLKNEVWNEAGLNWDAGYPTILEVEELLGRRLTKDDFNIEFFENWAEAHEHPNVLDRITVQGVREGMQHHANSPDIAMDGTPKMPKGLEIAQLREERAIMVDVAKRLGFPIDFTKYDEWIKNNAQGETRHDRLLRGEEK